MRYASVQLTAGGYGPLARPAQVSSPAFNRPEELL
jgi:hypothetical protein